MKMRGRRDHPPSDTRRYLVHLSCAKSELACERRYVLRIQPWRPRSSCLPQVQERLFEDESELIRTLNPLLPNGADVRHVLSHVERPEGFLYLLHLNSDQANSLGWNMRAGRGMEM